MKTYTNPDKRFSELNLLTVAEIIEVLSKYPPDMAVVSIGQVSYSEFGKDMFVEIPPRHQGDGDWLVICQCE